VFNIPTLGGNSVSAWSVRFSEGPHHFSFMAYEDVERLQPCAECGSRRYCFDGRIWRCVNCEPSALASPIRVEIRDDTLDAVENSRWPSVRQVMGCEVTVDLLRKRCFSEDESYSGCS